MPMDIVKDSKDHAKYSLGLFRENYVEVAWEVVENLP